MAFNEMRDVEPPYLHHNEMASYFEALCVIIEGPALGFLDTRTNLPRFLLNRKYFKYLGTNYLINLILIYDSVRTLNSYLLVAESINVTPSCVEDDSSQ